jgi:integrase
VEVHPHLLRHACGFALADQGADTRLIQDDLGPPHQLMLAAGAGGAPQRPPAAAQDEQL